MQHAQNAHPVRTDLVHVKNEIGMYYRKANVVTQAGPCRANSRKGDESFELVLERPRNTAGNLPTPLPQEVVRDLIEIQ